MRTMSDKERFFIIAKIFLHLKGPSTSKEISDYVNNCPVKLQRDFTPVRVGSLLRGQHWVKKERIPHGNNLKFEVKE